MPGFDRRKLAQLSREPRFLVQASISLVVIALSISAVLSSLPRNKNVHVLSPGDTMVFPGESVIPSNLNAKSLAAVIRNRSGYFRGNAPQDFQDIRFHELKGGDNSPDFELIHTGIKDSRNLTEDERILVQLLLDAIHGGKDKRLKAIEALQSISADKRYRNEFLADAYLANEDPEKGIDAYIREGETFPDATYSRRSAVIALTERREPGKLREVLAKPGFRKAMTPREGIATSLILRDHRQLLIDVFRIELELFKSPHLITALFTAAIWFLILVSLGSLSKPQLLLGILAFFLGILSGSLTLYVVYLQKYFLNLEFHVEDTLVNQVIALVAGIGLREETLKLLCFVPVCILILKFRSPVLALITAALTGLGFAMIENLQYFTFTPDKFVAWSRLLSANALHFCLTGIVGFSLFKVLLYKGRDWENFLIDFLFVIAIHAIYDGFLMIPMLAEYGIVTLIILALTAYRYLDLVRENMPTDGQLRKVSPLGVFVLGSALLACGIMVATSFNQTFIQSAGAFAGAIGGSIPIAFAFISRLRDL